MTQNYQLYKYEKHRIQEAIFEVKFSPENFDTALPGQFYEKVRDEFPDKNDLKVITISLGAGQSETQQKIPQAPTMQTGVYSRSLDDLENITNTMPPYASPEFVGRLYEEQERLIKQRNAILDVYVSLNHQQQSQLDAIDSQLDFVESYIAGLRKKSKLNVRAVKSAIEKDDLWIREMAKKFALKNNAIINSHTETTSI